MKQPRIINCPECFSYHLGSECCACGHIILTTKQWSVMQVMKSTSESFLPTWAAAKQVGRETKYVRRNLVSLEALGLVSRSKKREGVTGICWELT